MKGRELRLFVPFKNGWLKKTTILSWRFLKDNGYVLVRVVDHPIVGTCFIYEHRLVMTEKLGRKLKSSEIVHHDPKKGKTFNHPNSLELTDRSSHTSFHSRNITQARRKQMSIVSRGNKRALGYRHTNETKEQIGRSLRNKKLSKSHCRKITKSLLKYHETHPNIKLKESHKAKISAGLLRFYRGD